MLCFFKKKKGPLPGSFHFKETKKPQRFTKEKTELETNGKQNSYIGE
jgi:hypothetical protein